MRRFLSILLSMFMLFTMIPVTVLSEDFAEELAAVAEPVPAPVCEPEPAPAPVAEPEPVPVSEPESAPAAAEPEPAPAPVAEPEPVPVSEPEPARAAAESENEYAEEPAEESAEEPSEETLVESAETLDEESAEEPAEESAEEPSEESPEEIVETHDEEPAEEPAEESAEEPSGEFVEEPAEEPSEELAEESEEEPAEDPAAQVTEGYAIVLKDTDLYKGSDGQEKLAEIKKDAIVYVKVSEESRWAAFLWVDGGGMEAFIAAEDAELTEGVETQAEKHTFRGVVVYDMTDSVVLAETGKPAEYDAEEPVEESAVNSVEDPAEEQAEIVNDLMLLSRDEPTQLSEEDPLVQFVERAYAIILGREGDSAGVAYWVNNLRTGTNTGAQLIQGFVMAPEFTNARLNSEEKVDKMYNVMLGRALDPLGEDWVVKLDAGVDILAIVNGFAVSEEFGRVCGEYGINPGSIALSASVVKYNRITEYVMRCYSVILGRRADADGLKDWTNRLLSGAMGGANIVDEFVGSAEFKGQGNSNKKIVEILYQAMLGRPADEGGLADWKTKLDNGESVRTIVQGFSVSAEFVNLCRAYGIKPGSIVIKPNEINDGVTDFVKRCYLEGLEREAEEAGLNDWCTKIRKGVLTPAQVALGFVVAPECVQKYPTNTDRFVEMLYRLYMGREYDEAGKADWMHLIQQGMSRKDVANAFGGSREFKKIVASFNLDAGYGPGVPPEDEFDLNDVHYTVLGDGVVCLAKYNGNAATVVIGQLLTSPVQRNKYQVLTVGPGAFENNQTLVSIDLPDTVIEIDEAAFKDCVNLRNLY